MGYPIVQKVADFYANRVTPGSKPSAFDFLEVMGPDEYAWPVNNSGYTNRVAQIALLFATEAASLLGENPDPKVGHGP